MRRERQTSGQISYHGNVVGRSTILFDSTLAVAAASLDTGTGLVPVGTKAIEAHISVCSARAASTDAILIRVNNDATTSNYLTRFAFFSGGSGQSLQATVGGWYTECPANSGDLFASTIVRIPDPLGTKNVAAVIDEGYGDGGTWGREIIYGYYSGTTGVDRLSILSANGANLKAGTRMTVVGFF